MPCSGIQGIVVALVLAARAIHAIRRIAYAAASTRLRAEKLAVILNARERLIDAAS